jgi:hypothetical protein
MDFGGYINQSKLKRLLGFNGRNNPVAKTTGIREEIENNLETRERQQFMNRYVWKNLPKGLSANMMERILYYRGRIVVFQLNDCFYGLPFALNGNIDVYGRYMTVTPLTFNGSLLYNEKGEEYVGDGEWLPDMKIEVAYDIDDLEGKTGVILNDYSQGISEFIIPRYQLNKVFHKELANIVVLVRHNLISSARVFTLRILDEGQRKAVADELAAMEEDILENGKRVFTVTSSTQLEELLKDKTLETQNYWECFVSLDNLRENALGIENNGVFKKKERQLKGEMELEASSADLVYWDGLEQRRQFAEKFNALYGLNVVVEESPVITGIYEEEEGQENGNVESNMDDTPRGE